MKKLITVVILIGVAILMTQTVPSKKAHREAMMKAIKEYVDEEAANKGIKDNGITRFGKNVLTKTIEGVLSSKLKEDNYYLFNTTHIKMKEGNKLLSVGLFGQVITFNKDMLRDALEEAAQEKAEQKAEKQQLKADRKQQKAEQKALKKQQREQRRQERKAAKAAKQ